MTVASPGSRRSCRPSCDGFAASVFSTRGCPYRCTFCERTMSAMLRRTATGRESVTRSSTRSIIWCPDPTSTLHHHRRPVLSPNTPVRSNAPLTLPNGTQEDQRQLHRSISAGLVVDLDLLNTSAGRACVGYSSATGSTSNCAYRKQITRGPRYRRHDQRPATARH